ncbi:MAG: hypothetical protein F2534_00685 [Actinobacteria bacterium]|nr:hypothetical protein [Actinomycetota bacterium]
MDALIAAATERTEQGDGVVWPGLDSATTITSTARTGRDPPTGAATETVASTG